MLVGGDFAEEAFGDVFCCGLGDARRGDIHDVKVWLDVANDAHVKPEVGATAGGEDGEGSPVVEDLRGFVAGGIDAVGFEEVHLRLFKIK